MELAMPDLDLIKQGEHGRAGPARAVSQGPLRQSLDSQSRRIGAWRWTGSRFSPDCRRIRTTLLRTVQGRRSGATKVGVNLTERPQKETHSMSQEQSPRLSHVGLYVNDVPQMIDFYTRVLGFVVSDGAPDGRITFLSRNPSDHHQVVLVRGRATDLETPMVQQVSFNVSTLANVQRAYRKVT